MFAKVAFGVATKTRLLKGVHFYRDNYDDITGAAALIGGVGGFGTAAFVCGQEGLEAPVTVLGCGLGTGVGMLCGWGLASGVIPIGVGLYYIGKKFK